jgi:hypothetical protein
LELCKCCCAPYIRMRRYMIDRYTLVHEVYHSQHTQSNGTFAHAHTLMITLFHFATAPAPHSRPFLLFICCRRGWYEGWYGYNSFSFASTVSILALKAYDRECGCLCGFFSFACESTGRSPWYSAHSSLCGCSAFLCFTVECFVPRCVVCRIPHLPR